ncbi:MAG: DUF4034 domain-containing protein [Pseudomonadota bacterium]
MSKLFRLAGIVLLVGSLAHAETMTRDQVLDLLKNQNYEAMESLLTTHETAFRNDQIDRSDYLAGWRIFETSDPKIAKGLSAWKTASHNSGHVRTADGLRLTHLSNLMRGRQTMDALSKEGRAEVVAFADAATAALSPMMADGTLTLTGAYALAHQASIIEDHGLMERALDVIDRLDTSEEALMARLGIAVPASDHPAETAKELCSERTPHTPKFSADECAALASMASGTGEIDFPKALATLAGGDPDLFWYPKLMSDLQENPDEALEEVRRREWAGLTHPMWIAESLSSSKQDLSIIAEAADAILSSDPFDPEGLLLRTKAEMANRNLGAAWRAQRMALRYGTYFPDVRVNGLQMMAVSPQLRGALLNEVFDAANETNNHLLVLSSVHRLVVTADPRLFALTDGRLREDWACARRQLLERHLQACTEHGDHPSCQGEAATARDEAIAESIELGACQIDHRPDWLQKLVPRNEESDTEETLWSLAVGGKVDELERRYVQRADEFSAGDLSARDFKSGYSIFKTTHPEVIDTLATWGEKFPDSPHALTARGLALVHQGLLMRGEGSVRETPPQALKAMQARIDMALPLLERALTIDPKQVSAAHALIQISHFSGKFLVRKRGWLIVNRHDHPYDAMLVAMHYAMPQWGGNGPEQLYEICENQIDKIADAGIALTLEQCLAIGAHATSQLSETTARILLTLPDGFNHSLKIEAYMKLSRYDEAWDYAERVGWFTDDLVESISIAEDDVAMMIHWMDHRLQFDPYNPKLLVRAAWQAQHNRDDGAVFELMEKAKRFGLHNSSTRRSILYTTRFDKTLDEAEEAYRDTDGSLWVLQQAIESFSYPGVREASGLPEQEFLCRRQVLLTAHREACQRAGNDESCAQGVVDARNRLSAQLANAQVCKGG